MLSGPQQNAKSGSPKKLVVLLHGYGANGENLIDLAQMWSEDLPDVEFHAPNALEPCVGIPFGYQWFGIADFNPLTMRSGINKAAPILKDYIDHLLTSRKLQSSDLALVGFSQGTMMALEMMFHIPGLNSILGYSGVFYPPSLISAKPPVPKVLLIHGTADMVVPYYLMEESAKQLQRFDVNAKTHTSYGLGHSIDLEGISLGGKFLAENFSDTIIQAH